MLAINVVPVEGKVLTGHKEKALLVQRVSWSSRKTAGVPLGCLRRTASRLPSSAPGTRLLCACVAWASRSARSERLRNAYARHAQRA